MSVVYRIHTAGAIAGKIERHVRIAQIMEFVNNPLAGIRDIQVFHLYRQKLDSR